MINMRGYNLLDGLNGVSKASIQGHNINEFTEITLSPYEVHEAPQNTRMECKNIEELADAFLMVGQQQPTILAKIDGEFWIVDGHRRNRANILNIERGYLKYQKVRFFYQDMTRAFYEVSLLFGNGLTQDLTQYEKMELVIRLKKALIRARDEDGIQIRGKIRDYISDCLNESAGNIARMEKISKSATDEVKECFKNDKLGISAAYEASRLSEEQQRELVQIVEFGGEIRAKEIAKMVRERKQEKEEERKNIIDQESEPLKGQLHISQIAGVVPEEQLKEIRDREQKVMEAEQRVAETAKKVETAAKKAHDSCVAAAQSTVNAERAAENADSSAKNIREITSEIKQVSDLDTEKTGWKHAEWVTYTLVSLLEDSFFVSEIELQILQDILMKCNDRRREWDA